VGQDILKRGDRQVILAGAYRPVPEREAQIQPVGVLVGFGSQQVERLVCALLSHQLFDFGHQGHCALRQFDFCLLLRPKISAGGREQRDDSENESEQRSRYPGSGTIPIHAHDVLHSKLQIRPVNPGIS